MRYCVCLYLSYSEVSCTEDAGPGDVSWSQDSVSFMSRFRVGVSSRSQKNVKRYFDFEFTVLGEHGAQQGIFEISIFRDLIRFGLKNPMESHPKCLSDDSVSFMSEFHEVWCPDGIGWVSGCGHFHIDDRKSFPKEGCSLSSVKWNSKEDL